MNIKILNSDETLDVSTWDELIESPLCKEFAEDGYVIAHSHNIAIRENFIVAMRYNEQYDEGCEVRVLGYVDTDEDKKEILQWLPDRKLVLQNIKTYKNQ